MAHGQICYIQIPAADAMRSAEFYEKVFGWQIERPYASFMAPGMMGQWTTDLKPAKDCGLLIWINVENVDDILDSVRAGGGEVLSKPAPDGPRWLATFRDPGGNVIGVVQHGDRGRK